VYPVSASRQASTFTFGHRSPECEARQQPQSVLVDCGSDGIDPYPSQTVVMDCGSDGLDNSIGSQSAHPPSPRQVSTSFLSSGSGSCSGCDSPPPAPALGSDAGLLAALADLCADVHDPVPAAASVAPCPSVSSASKIGLHTEKPNSILQGESYGSDMMMQMMRHHPRADDEVVELASLFSGHSSPTIELRTAYARCESQATTARSQQHSASSSTMSMIRSSATSQSAFLDKLRTRLGMLKEKQKPATSSQFFFSESPGAVSCTTEVEDPGRIDYLQADDIREALRLARRAQEEATKRKWDEERIPEEDEEEEEEEEAATRTCDEERIPEEDEEEEEEEDECLDQTIAVDDPSSSSSRPVMAVAHQNGSEVESVTAEAVDSQVIDQHSARLEAEEATDLARVEAEAMSAARLAQQEQDEIVAMLKATATETVWRGDFSDLLEIAEEVAAECELQESMPADVLPKANPTAEACASARSGARDVTDNPQQAPSSDEDTADSTSLRGSSVGQAATLPSSSATSSVAASTVDARSAVSHSAQLHLCNSAVQTMPVTLKAVAGVGIVVGCGMSGRHAKCEDEQREALEVLQQLQNTTTCGGYSSDPQSSTRDLELEQEIHEVRLVNAKIEDDVDEECRLARSLEDQRECLKAELLAKNTVLKAAEACIAEKNVEVKRVAAALATAQGYTTLPWEAGVLEEHINLLDTQLTARDKSVKELLDEIRLVKLGSVVELNKS